MNTQSDSSAELPQNLLARTALLALLLVTKLRLLATETDPEVEAFLASLPTNRRERLLRRLQHNCDFAELTGFGVEDIRLLEQGLRLDRASHSELPLREQLLKELSGEDAERAAAWDCGWQVLGNLAVLADDIFRRPFRDARAVRIVSGRAHALAFSALVEHERSGELESHWFVRLLLNPDEYNYFRSNYFELQDGSVCKEFTRQFQDDRRHAGLLISMNDWRLKIEAARVRAATVPEVLTEAMIVELLSEPVPEPDAPLPPVIPAPPRRPAYVPPEPRTFQPAAARSGSTKPQRAAARVHEDDPDSVVEDWKEVALCVAVLAVLLFFLPQTTYYLGIWWWSLSLGFGVAVVLGLAAKPMLRLGSDRFSPMANA